MGNTIRPRRVSHMNAVVENLAASVAHLRTLYGARFLLDLPGPHWHACLIEIGGVLIELFAPSNFLLNSRHGAHYLGIEYEADVENARAVCAAQGIRIIRDIDVAFHTHPADGFGVDYEIYGRNFFDPDNPYLTTATRPIEYWRDEHPLGLNGIRGYSQAVGDLAATGRFVQAFLGAEPVYEADRPALAARAMGLRIADDVVELLTPTGDGPLRREIEVLGQGIRSTIFRATSLGKVRRYFGDRGIALVPGTLPGSLAVPPRANLGLAFEFAE